MDAMPLSTSQIYCINGGTKVKGEEEYIDRIFFDEEEGVVEREIKRKLTKTPEEFVAQEKDSTKEKERRKALSRYYIKRALLQKQGHKQHNLYRCPECFERGKLTLYKVSGNGDNPGVSDYILLCGACVKKKREEKKKTKLWSRGPGINGGTPESKQMAFFASIRALVFARDGAECPYCGSTENLGLGALMPLSRGGRLCFDNYVVICQECRGKMSGNKGNLPMTPLEYLWRREEAEADLSESLDHGVTTENPGATIRMSVHLWGRYEKLLAMMRVCKSLEELAKIRNIAEPLHIEFCKTDDDRRRERQQLPW